MPHDDPSGPPPYNPGGPGSDDGISPSTMDDVLYPHTKDFHTAVEEVKAAIEAQKGAISGGNIEEAKQHAAKAVHFGTDMLRHLRQQMAQSLADGEPG